MLCETFFFISNKVSYCTARTHTHTHRLKIFASAVWLTIRCHPRSANATRTITFFSLLVDLFHPYHYSLWFESLNYIMLIFCLSIFILKQPFLKIIHLKKLTCICACAAPLLMHPHRSGGVAVFSLCETSLKVRPPVSVWGSVVSESTQTPQALFIQR